MPEPSKIRLGRLRQPCEDGVGGGCARPTGRPAFMPGSPANYLFGIKCGCVTRDAKPQAYFKGGENFSTHHIVRFPHPNNQRCAKNKITSRFSQHDNCCGVSIALIIPFLLSLTISDEYAAPKAWPRLRENILIPKSAKKSMLLPGQATRL